MSLIKCKECSREISTKAKSCPGCGAPVQNSSSMGKIVIFFLVLFVIWILLLTYQDEQAPKTDKPVSPANTPTTENTAISAPPPATPEPHESKYDELEGSIEQIKAFTYLRKLPDKASGDLKYLREGEEVKVIEESKSGWQKVATPDGAIGYVMGQYLSRDYSSAPVKRTTPPPPPLEIVDWNWVKNSGFGTDGAIIWNVRIKNNTNKYIELLPVELTTYDSAGSLITSDRTFVRGLSPGGAGSGKSYATYFGKEAKASIRIIGRNNY